MLNNVTERELQCATTIQEIIKGDAYDYILSLLQRSEDCAALMTFYGDTVGFRVAGVEGFGSVEQSKLKVALEQTGARVVQVLEFFEIQTASLFLHRSGPMPFIIDEAAEMFERAFSLPFLLDATKEGLRVGALG